MINPEKDPYTDNNDVLKNKLNLKTTEELDQASADIGFMKLINIDIIPLEHFDPDILRRIHWHIFHDIFEWAGEYRNVPLVKEEYIFPGYTIPYTDFREIENEVIRQMWEMERIAWEEKTMEEIASILARRIALLWKVHPFRDGNTRTMLCYAYLFGKEHGFPMDMLTFTDNLARIYYEDGTIARHSIRDKFVIASLEEKDKPETEHLAHLFEEAMNNYQKEENRFHR